LINTLALQEAKDSSEIENIITTNDLQASRLTATKCLDRLTDGGFVEKRKIGRYSYLINVPLMRIFTEIPDQPEASDAPAMASD
jgi:predicted transcriptional regulator